MVPGTISWAVLILPLWLSFSYPWIVAYFVLSFDFYWLCRALWFSGAVIVAYRRIRDVLAVDWSERLASLAARDARIAELEMLLGRRGGMARGAVGIAVGAGSARAERRRLRRELTELRAMAAAERRARPVGRGPHPPRADPDLHRVPREAAAHGPRARRGSVAAERKICAIITRETDEGGIENVRTLQAEFRDAFAEFIHILDPLEPGIVVGKSSAMAWGGRYLYRKLVRERGMDPHRIIVTDLDADYRIHPQYFAYLSWMHLTDPNRETQLYQPIPYFHNNIWHAPMLQRLFAAVLTQLQMWRSVLPEKLQSFGSYSTTLHLVHDVGYWATDAIPEDSRFYWKSYFRYGDRFRAVPLFIPIYGDAVRARGYWRSMAEQYLQARRWAWGVTDIPYVVDNAVRHTQIPLASRFWRVANLFGEHINWAIAPFVIMFGATVPLLINPAFGETTLGQNLPLYASVMLTVALVGLAVLIIVEHRIVPPRPAEWGWVQRVISYIQWIGLPFVGIIFSMVPALDAQTRLLTGRYLEYKVTEKV